jgi:hypothetical protein
MNLNKNALLFSIAAIASQPAFAVSANPGYFGISGGQATVEDFCGGGESS